MKSVEFEFNTLEEESQFDELISSLKELGNKPATISVYFSKTNDKIIRKIKDYLPCFYINDQLAIPPIVKHRLLFWLKVLNDDPDIIRYVQKPNKLIVYSDNPKFVGGGKEEWYIFPFLLALQYVEELNKLFKIGLNVGYERINTTIIPIKGRIEFTKEPLSRAKCKVTTPQEIFKRTYNTLENQLLKTAVDLLLKDPYIHHESDLALILKKYQKMFEELNVEEIELSKVDWISISSSIPHYHQPILLAKNIIKSIGFYSGQGKAVSFAILEYMLFEALMSKIVEEVVRERGLHVEIQKTSKITFISDQEETVKYIPDILIEDKKNKKLIIMDLKNKIPTENESNPSGISNQDLYQMISYWLFHKIDKYKDYNITTYLVYRIEETEESNLIKNRTYKLSLKPWLKNVNKGIDHRFTLVVSQICLLYNTKNTQDIEMILKDQVQEMLNLSY